MEQYSNFAFIYDDLMNDVDYDGWVKYIEDIIKDENLKVQNILELACGTGNMTIPLTKKNYDIAAIDISDIIKDENLKVQNILELACGTGNMTIPLTKKNYDIAAIDISDEMLSVAREKAEKEGVELVLLQQDLAEFDFEIDNLDCILCACDGFNYEGVELVLLQQDLAEFDFEIDNLDCILCACDGFNYITYDDDLQHVFNKSYELLKHEGILIFDISSYYKLANVLGNNMYGENREDVAYMWQNYFDEEENLVEMELSFFIKDENGKFDRFKEVHQQRAYTEDEIIEMLNEAGFEYIKTYGDFTFEAPNEETERIFFVCKK